MIFAEKEDDYEELGQKVTAQTAKIGAIMEDLKVLKDEIEVSKIYQGKLIRRQEFGIDVDEDY